MSYELRRGRPLTVREYAALPKQEYGDLVAGWLVREPRPATWHALVSLAIARELDLWVRPRRLGIVLPEAGFLLKADPPTVRGPDVSFVAAERVPPGGPASGFWPGAPDLAVEVVTASSRAAVLEARLTDLIESGTRVVWVVDTRSRTVTVRIAGEPSRVLTGSEAIEGEPVLPGLRLRVATLFEDLPAAT